MAALIWLILGVVLVAAEILSGDFVLVMLGLAALGAAGASALGADAVLGAAAFAVLALGLVVGARPVLKRRLESGLGHRSGVDALPGSTAVVVSTVDGHGGRVRIGGEVWSARSIDHAVIEPGAEVTVVEISGATAVVLSGS
ncbi:membrane protein implicated in regulation of membrane protease activity [Saccharothrix tamanrassetensis]|uniref:Membrane protein implicated in regulation of membrane protease activity n=1 Tax=Saccharothrix tamanrassetensis TaxID=1051531 RepID=A0A841C7T5_9PSEU|nr:NfeD family protein [Saccharothrix tamanrassetensis]MBB5953469.1 membrane protein implicated in regulation of membrane protease activity [Saccharothrix tamanrassetensis]